MKPVLAALNLGEKNETLSPSANVLHNTSNLVISTPRKYVFFGGELQYSSGQRHTLTKIP